MGQKNDSTYTETNSTTPAQDSHEVMNETSNTSTTNIETSSHDSQKVVNEP